MANTNTWWNGTDKKVVSTTTGQHWHYASPYNEAVTFCSQGLAAKPVVETLGSKGSQFELKDGNVIELDATCRNCLKKAR